MYHVYFLYSQKKNNTHVGCTSNLETRLKEHNQGRVKSTKNTIHVPLILIYEEMYDTLSLVKKREDYLKSLYGLRERKGIIKEALEKNKVGPYTEFSIENSVGLDKIS